MSKIIIACLFVLLCNPSTGQHRTYFGVEAAATFDQYEITDDGGALQNMRLLTALGGLNLRQELNKFFFIETGIIRKYYDEGISFKMAEYYVAATR